MDKLTIEGVSTRFDGVYDCDVVGMIRDLTSPEALTGDEACFIQDNSKVRGNELVEAFVAGDARFLMALAAVVLQRHGKTLDIDVLRQKKLGAYTFDLEPVPEGEEAAHPTGEGERSTTTSRNGGTSSSSPSDSQDASPHPIGAPV